MGNHHFYVENVSQDKGLSTEVFEGSQTVTLRVQDYTDFCMIDLTLEETDQLIKILQAAREMALYNG